MDVGAVKAPTIRRSQVLQTITTIGLDIAKSVFQVHGVDNDGKVVIRRQLKRRYVRRMTGLCYARRPIQLNTQLRSG